MQTDMTATAGKGWLVRGVRWTARGLSVLTLLVVLAFVFGENGTPTAKDVVLFCLFPVGVVAGLLVAWVREGAGAAISLCCLGAVVVLGVVRTGNVAGLGMLSVFAIPGVLFAACAVMERGRRRATRGGTDA